MRLHLRVCALLLLAGGVGAARGQSGDELMRQGAQAMHAGNAAAAEAAFRSAAEAAPNFAPARLDLGLAELKEGKVSEAIADIRKALELDPTSPGAHLFLGIAEYQSSRPEEAVADLQQAIQEDPQNEQPYTWLGIVELNMGHPEKAVEPLDRAAELAPTDENVLDYRVQAHLAVAKQSFTQLYRVDPTSWRLHQLNAVIDAQADDHQHAVEEYTEAIKLAPKQPTLYEALGWEYRALSQNELAVQAFEEQLKLSPGNPIAMYNLASAEVENGQAQAAIPLLEKVVRVYSVPTQADYYLGRALTAKEKYSDAAAAFERATQVGGPVQLRAWYELSQVYRHLGETAKARAAVVKYQALKQQTDAAAAKNVQDFLKLNQANAAAGGGSQH